jgi:hypothetical protein
VAIGDFMGKTSREKRIHDYGNIAHEISINPAVQGKVIAQKVDLSRNTVSKHLKRMYERHILVGPWISLMPHPDYTEYVYLMNFSDSFTVFEQLKGFPHVLYQGAAFGDWNTVVITDRFLDFSQLVGFQSVVYQGEKGIVFTPPVTYCPWNTWLQKMYDHLDTLSLKDESGAAVIAPPLNWGVNWGENEWKLYHAFRQNMRKKTTHVLKRLHIRYDIYTQWMKTLHDHCTIHTEFYPEGLTTYAQYCFLIDTDYNQSVKSLLSLFPTTPVIMEVGTQLLVFLKVVSSEATKNMIVMICDMKARGIINEVRKAHMIFEYKCEYGEVLYKGLY